MWWKGWKSQVKDWEAIWQKYNKGIWYLIMYLNYDYDYDDPCSMMQNMNLQNWRLCMCKGLWTVEMCFKISSGCAKFSGLASVFCAMNTVCCATRIIWSFQIAQVLPAARCACLQYSPYYTCVLRKSFCRFHCECRCEKKVLKTIKMLVKKHCP